MWQNPNREFYLGKGNIPFQLLGIFHLEEIRLILLLAEKVSLPTAFKTNLETSEN